MGSRKVWRRNILFLMSYFVVMMWTVSSICLFFNVTVDWTDVAERKYSLYLWIWCITVNVETLQTLSRLLSSLLSFILRSKYGGTGELSASLKAAIKDSLVYSITYRKEALKLLVEFIHGWHQVIFILGIRKKKTTVCSTVKLFVKYIVVIGEPVALLDNTCAEAHGSIRWLSRDSFSHVMLMFWLVSYVFRIVYVQFMFSEKCRHHDVVMWCLWLCTLTVFPWTNPHDFVVLLSLITWRSGQHWCNRISFFAPNLQLKQ